MIQSMKTEEQLKNDEKRIGVQSLSKKKRKKKYISLSNTENRDNAVLSSIHSNISQVRTLNHSTTWVDPEEQFFTNLYSNI